MERGAAASGARRSRRGVHKLKRTRGRRGRQRPRGREATTPHIGRRHIRPACLKAESNPLGQFVSSLGRTGLSPSQMGLP